LGGPLPEFLKSIYKIQSDSDHVVKFQGDRSRELGEPVAKQKKHLGQNISPSGTAVPGGLINYCIRVPLSGRQISWATFDSTIVRLGILLMLHH